MHRRPAMRAMTIGAFSWLALVASLGCGGDDEAVPRDAPDAPGDARAIDAPAIDAPTGPLACAQLGPGRATDEVQTGTHRCRGDVLERLDPGAASWRVIGSCVARDSCDVPNYPWTSTVPILHWDGTSRTVGSVCLPFLPLAFTARNATDVWLLVNGADPGGRATAIWRWDGTSWTEAFRMPTIDGLALAADGCGGVWLTGRKGFFLEDPQVVLRWDGTGWIDHTPADLPQGALRAVQEAGDGSLWLAGTGGAWRRTATEDWRRVASVPELYSIAATSADDAWMTSHDLRFVHWNGYDVTSTAALPERVDAYPLLVTGFAADDVWANGFLHWNGSSWSPTSDLGAPLAYCRVDATTVLAFEPRESCIALGWTKVWRFDGTTWRRDESGLEAALPAHVPYATLWGCGDDLWLALAPFDGAC